MKLAFSASGFGDGDVACCGAGDEGFWGQKIALDVPCGGFDIKLGGVATFKLYVTCRGFDKQTALGNNVFKLHVCCCGVYGERPATDV